MISFPDKCPPHKKRNKILHLTFKFNKNDKLIFFNKSKIETIIIIFIGIIYIFRDK
jgi:hypothetical protein